MNLTTACDSSINTTLPPATPTRSQIPPTRWRRCFRVSIRSLLAVIFTFSVLLAIETNRIHNQSRIETLMATAFSRAAQSERNIVGYEVRYPILENIPFLQTVFGKNWNRDITSLRVESWDAGLTPIPDELIDRLPRLRRLRIFAIYYDDMTNEQASRLRKLKYVRWLHLQHAPRYNRNPGDKIKSKTIDSLRLQLPNTFVTSL